MSKIYYISVLQILVHLLYVETRSYYPSVDQLYLERHHQARIVAPARPTETNEITDDVDEDDEHGEPGAYSYEYRINSPQTGDYKTQHEERIGDTVRGSYSLIEPDGSKRIVEYTADPRNGFQAVVKHEPPSPNMLAQYALDEPEPIRPRAPIPTPKIQNSATSFAQYDHIPVPVTSSAPPPHFKSTTDRNARYKNVLYALPQSFIPQTNYLKTSSSTTTPATTSAPRYYINPFARLSNWPFFY